MAEDGKAEEVSPPFHGFIATTYDALLVFEAARRGIIPRVTRRLNDSERTMVQSGAVFVYDEQESGIKRWTDGHSWSPSRILANFLVYRETVKPAEGGKEAADEMNVKREAGGSRPGSSHGRPTTANSSPGGNASPGAGDLNLAESSRMASERRTLPTLAHGQMRPRSAAEAAGGGCRLENGIVINRNQERQLVGSLTNSYLFQPGGLVKKTMTLIISGFHQHVVSYYTLEDAVAGRLRRPSMIPEFASLQISPDYLNIANFRYPPSIEVGIDGIPRYHGEPDDRPASRGGAPPVWNAEMHEGYGPPLPLDPHYQPRMRAVTVPNVGSNFPPAPMSAGYPMPPGSAAGHDLPGMHSMQPAPRPSSGPTRPSTTGSRRFDPYGSSSRGDGNMSLSGSESGGHVRRQSQPPSAGEGSYYQSGGEYNYQPPSTAPGAFPYYSAAPAPGPPSQPVTSPLVSPSYSSGQYGWHGQASDMRILSAPPASRGMLGEPPSSSGSESAAGSAHVMGTEGWAPMAPASTAPQVWDSHSNTHANSHSGTHPNMHPHGHQSHQSHPSIPQQYTVPQSEGWQTGFA